MRITGFVLADEDVSAPGPSVETGASVPGYSGGAAACVDCSYTRPEHRPLPQPTPGLRKNLKDDK